VYHVEVRSSFRHHAQVFNLDEDRLRREILEPWTRGSVFELGGQEWDSAESTLKILEGPELEPPELMLGRGWSNAERAGMDVTARMVETGRERPAVVVVAETAEGQATVAEILNQMGARPSDWDFVRARLTAAASASDSSALDLERVAAVVVCESADPSPAWIFDAGLALGALPGRAVVIQLGDADRASALRDLAAVRVDPARPATLVALAERLRHAGCALKEPPPALRPDEGSEAS
jgi:hypothetical protein